MSLRTVILFPYCPLPVNTGSKREIWKHLEVLKELGECRIVSAATKPVGYGWTPETRAEIERRGYWVSLREESTHISAIQLLGVGFAAICKAFGFDKAFGHSNPYHRYAFPAEWWKKYTEGADLAVINYSYWSWLPCACPKVVILHDLLSSYMWGNAERMIKDLGSADLVIAISEDEEKTLNEWGISKTFWSPPEVKAADFPCSSSIGCVGSANRFNIEGLRWLDNAWSGSELKINIYGGLADHVSAPGFLRIGEYADASDPYRDCGIILMPTAGGMGVQIKAIEALAAGRAIIARRGAMRGIPSGEGAWLEVDYPGEMVTATNALVRDSAARESLGHRARDYYEKYLNCERIRSDLATTYKKITDRSASMGYK